MGAVYTGAGVHVAGDWTGTPDERGREGGVRVSKGRSFAIQVAIPALKWSSLVNESVHQIDEVGVSGCMSTQLRWTCWLLEKTPCCQQGDDMTRKRCSVADTLGYQGSCSP